VRPLFDYIFVDEAQDFPPSFLRLALRLAEDEKLVIAYDVFQTIFDVEIPTAEVIFGLKANGEPLVSFQEDLVLHRCYRNPLEILVCAHAIGFGLYSNRVVQMLESKEHWEDFGYKLESGRLESGEQVVVSRPSQNSPISVGRPEGADELIEVATFNDVKAEVALAAEKIVHDIKVEGLSPEDILVICADDRNARAYFGALSETLRKAGVRTHNLQDDSYSIRNFAEKDHVTLATVYKAKGNEAVVVFVVGIDALFHSPDSRSRNIIFTAMTRAKGWLRVSGIGPSAAAFKKELDTAKANVPYLKFVYPSEAQLIRIKRDQSQDGVAIAESTMDELEQNLSSDEYEQMLLARLQQVRRKKQIGSKPISPRRSNSR
jgi:superfamily I DNA and RNA helicase